jgi:hypothetical protein
MPDLLTVAELDRLDPSKRGEDSLVDESLRVARR